MKRDAKNAAVGEIPNASKTSVQDTLAGSPERHRCRSFALKQTNDDFIPVIFTAYKKEGFDPGD